MDDQHLKRILTDHAEQEIPTTMDMKFSILNAAKAEQKSKNSFPLRRIAAVAALALALGTTGYAVASGLLWQDAGMETVQEDDLVTEIALTNPISTTAPITDLSVTLDYAYADINRVAVAYHVTGEVAEGAEVQLYTNPLLTDSQGREYIWLPAAGSQTVNDAGEGELDYSGIMSFDASALEGNPETLSLTLNVDVAYSTADDPMGMQMAGGTSFSFEVPFRPGTTLAISQSAAASNVSMTLDRVTVAPSMSRLDLCVDPSHFDADPQQMNAWLAWQAVVSVSVDGSPIVQSQPLGVDVGAADSACRAISIPAALGNQAGEWIVTISDFQNLVTNEVISGMWTYTFEVND